MNLGPRGVTPITPHPGKAAAPKSVCPPWGVGKTGVAVPSPQAGPAKALKDGGESKNPPQHHSRTRFLNPRGHREECRRADPGPRDGGAQLLSAARYAPLTSGSQSGMQGGLPNAPLPQSPSPPQSACTAAPSWATPKLVPQVSSCRSSRASPHSPPKAEEREGGHVLLRGAGERPPVPLVGEGTTLLRAAQWGSGELGSPSPGLHPVHPEAPWDPASLLPFQRLGGGHLGTRFSARSKSLFAPPAPPPGLRLCSATPRPGPAQAGPVRLFPPPAPPQVILPL